MPDLIELIRDNRDILSLLTCEEVQELLEPCQLAFEPESETISNEL